MYKFYFGALAALVSNQSELFKIQENQKEIHEPNSNENAKWIENFVEEYKFLMVLTLENIFEEVL